MYGVVVMSRIIMTSNSITVTFNVGLVFVTNDSVSFRYAQNAACVLQKEVFIIFRQHQFQIECHIRDVYNKFWVNLSVW